MSVPRKSFGTVECYVGEDNVGHFQLNRPKSANALNKNVFDAIPQGLAWLEAQGARAIVVSGNGRHFCSGIDLAFLGSALSESECNGRSTLALYPIVRWMQDSLSAFEKCRVPTIAAIHGACVGGAIDLVTACDIRLSSTDAFFSVKEVDLAITPDLGTLARLPSIVGHGVALEWALTARTFNAEEALRTNLVTRLLSSHDECFKEAHRLAFDIASKPPIAIIGTKRTLLYQRDHSVRDGLKYVAQWSAGTVPNKDFEEVFSARVEGRKPVFAKL